MRRQLSNMSHLKESIYDYDIEPRWIAVATVNTVPYKLVLNPNGERDFSCQLQPTRYESVAYGSISPQRDMPVTHEQHPYGEPDHGYMYRRGY
jgi:hypothetical protein